MVVPADPPNALIQRRVLYIGSAVPMETSEGLEAMQQPLREIYPIHDDSNVQGVDAMLTVLPNGLELKHLGDSESVIWFPINSLTICAAVKCIDILNGGTGQKTVKFVSLNASHSKGDNSKRPAIFAAITRRTVGRKILECHGFVCSTPKDALDLVQVTKMADSRSDKYITNGPLSSARNTSVVHRNESLASTINPRQQGVPIKVIPADDLDKVLKADSSDVNPRHGYFYANGSDLVKKYTLSRSSDPSAPSTNGGTPIILRANPGKKSARSMVHSPPPRMIRALSPRFQATLGHPARPVRVGQPPVMRYHGAPYHGPMVRDPYIFAPPPPVYINAPYLVKRRHKPRITKSYSQLHGDSSTDSSGDEGTHLKYGVSKHDISSESISRPRTPPADYGRGRLSRKSQFELQQRLNHPVVNQNGFLPRGNPMYDEYAYYIQPGRPKSVPPMFGAPTYPQQKPPKGKKKKRAKRMPSGDISSDSHGGYHSENHVSALDRTYGQPRDWRRNEKQFQNERAFARSIAEESRRGKYKVEPSAYAINQNTFDQAEKEETEIKVAV